MLENKNYSLSTDIFNIKSHSDEALDVLSDIEGRVGKIIQSYDRTIDLDDSGLDGKGDTIIYKAEIFRFDKNNRFTPLKDKEKKTIISTILNTIMLPKEDEDYEYSVKASMPGTQLSIIFRREEKY